MYSDKPLFISPSTHDVLIYYNTFQAKIKAFSDKDEVVAILYIKEDTEVVLTSTAGRMLLVDTGAVSPKTTKDTAGVNVMTLKKYHKLQSVRFYKEGEFAKPHRYRTKTLPAAGATLSADDTAEQLSFM